MSNSFFVDLEPDQIGTLIAALIERIRSLEASVTYLEVDNKRLRAAEGGAANG